MTSAKSKRERRLSEAKKRAALYQATPKSRYGQQPVRSNAWANAQRRKQRRTILKVVGAFSVVVAVLVIVIVIQHNRNDNAASTADSATSTPLTTDPSGTVAPTTTIAPVAPPALVATEVVGATGALAITKPLSSYDIIYDSTYNSSGRSSTSTNDYLIQRPFNSLLSIKSADPEANTDFTAVSSLGIYSNVSGGTPNAQTNIPTAGLADFRYDASLADLLTAGTYVLRERRTLIGRECQLYRTGQSPETYALAVPTATDFADLCIDASGLILEEITVVSGNFQEHIVATSVNESPTIGADTFKAVAAPPALSASGTSLTDLDAAKPPVPGYWGFTTLPTGYTLKGRYTFAQNIADPSADTASTVPTTPPATESTDTTVAKTIVVPSYVDVFTNGIDYIVIHQGPTSVLPTDDARSATATTSALLGSVKTASGVTGTTMLIAPPSPASWFLEVSGTLAKDALAKIADTLTQSPQ